MLLWGGSLLLASGKVRPGPAWGLALASLAVFVLPGWILLRILERRVESGPNAFLQAIPRSFGLSFSLLTLLSVIATEAGLNSRSTLSAWLLMTGVLLFISFVRPGARVAFRGDVLDWGLLLGFVAAVVILYRLGGLYAPLPDGEDALHLTMIRKLHSNEIIRKDNLMYRPGIPSTYVYLPYHLGVALVARLSGLDPLGAYVHLRPLWALVAITALGGLAQVLLGDRRAGQVGTLVGLVLAWNGQAGNWDGPFGRLLPYSHHGDVSLGVLLPVCLLAVGQFLASAPKLYEYVATPALLASVTIAHTREGVQMLFYLMAILAGLWALARAPAGAVRRTAGLTAFLLLFGFSYSRIHAGSVEHLEEWERAEKTQARELLSASAERPVEAVLGPPVLSNRPNYLTNFRILFHPYFVFGLLLVPFLALARRGVGTSLIFLPCAATLLVLGVPLLSLLMILATYSQILFTPARYIMHFCYLSVGLWVYIAATVLDALTAIFMSEIRKGRGLELDLALGGITLRRHWTLPFDLKPAFGFALGLVLAAATGFLTVGCARSLGAWAVHNQNTCLKILLAVHVVALGVLTLTGPLRSSPGPGPEYGGSRRWLALLFCLTVPIALWSQKSDKRLGIRGQDLLTAAGTSATEPDVLAFDQWYRNRQPMEIPVELLEDIRARIPPQSVFAADPHWMWMLPALANQYVFSSSQFLSSEIELVQDFCRIHGIPQPTDSVGAPRLYQWIQLYGKMTERFPLFNDQDDAAITLAFLESQRIDYVVLGPSPPSALSRALSTRPAAFTVAASRGPYIVFAVRHADLGVRLPGNEHGGSPDQPLRP